jgi:NAD(P)-dependent dehydrogenase (short-subunit alcohol dehydrogenase family)
MRIEGATVLVTGTTRGIGRALTRELSDRGARVLAGTRDGSRRPQRLRVRGAGADGSRLARVDRGLL